MSVSTKARLTAPAAVLAPLATLAPTADHRFNVYWHGGDFRAHPLRQLTEPFRTVPLYLDFGNFRPLGRLVERGVDVAAYAFVEVLHLPANIALRLVSFLAAIVLTAAAVLLARAVTGETSRLTALVPFAVAPGFVAAGGTSTAVLFGGLYYLSGALVLAVAAWMCRGRGPAVLALLAGAGLAAFNEIAYLALPLAVVAVVARGRLVLGLSVREVLRSRPARLTGLLWLGFLPVFLPVRVLIARACATGDCYSGSDLVLGDGLGLAWVNRMVAWLPPAQWAEATRGRTPGYLVGLLALVLLGLLALGTARELRALPGAGRRPALAVAAVAGAALILGAAMAAGSGDMQQAAAAGRWGLGWRDGALATVAGPLTLLSLLTALGAALPRRPSGAGGVAAVGLLAVLVVAGAGSAAANARYRDDTGGRATALTNNAIAREIADFDRSAAGDARRCGLRDEFRALYPDIPYSRFARAEVPGTTSPAERLEVTAGMATGQMYGRPFCRGSDS
ncbi:hypothetical protein [Actinoplanes sp. NPDC051494]|uniref:hypothetical protein n=1 Tax=Actinoplanes sp. NPDC051494 TaxID=3363907 RepID=UPI0037A7CA70